MKKFAGDIIIIHMCTKNHNHIMYDFWNTEWDRQKSLSFWTIFCPFTPLTTQKIKIRKNEKNAEKYYHFTQVYHKWQSHEVWFLKYRAWRTKFFVVLDHFLLFYTPSNSKIQNLKKWRKMSRDVIILHMGIINDNHMMYGSWDMEHDGQKFLSFWAIFCTFIPLMIWKIKILKKWKHHLEILSLYTCVP